MLNDRTYYGLEWLDSPTFTSQTEVKLYTSRPSEITSMEGGRKEEDLLV